MRSRIMAAIRRRYVARRVAAEAARRASLRRTQASSGGDGGGDMPDQPQKARARTGRKRSKWIDPLLVFGLFMALVFLLWAVAGNAVEPEEMLEDPVLEERAREISKGLRCVVCQNQSIDESDAGIAADMRVMVRALLVEGETDDGVRQALVAAYGDYVLLRPQFTWSNAFIWGAPVLAVLLGGFWYLQRTGRAATAEAPAPSTPPAAAPLTAAEQERLKRLLKDEP